jgi:hypothetical protein
VTPPGLSLEARFWLKVQKTDSCWLWIGAMSGGYGAFRVFGQNQVQAHRVAYELLVGSIPEGHHVHHICENRRCCNPAHLKVMEAAAHHALHNPPRTHCPKGHPYVGSNLRVAPSGSRHCRACERERGRRRRQSARVTG